MELNSCLLFLIISHITQGIANIKLFPYSKNWFEAHNYCLVQGGRLASPEEMSPSTCTNESIWSSKYDNKRLTPWIAKIGCSTGREPKCPKSSLLDCYKSCKSTTFGYKKHWCSCEEETRIDITPYSTCNSADTTHVWLYNKTSIHVRDDNYTMDCITAQCTKNGTIFRAVNCFSKQLAYCQKQHSTFNTTEKKTHANSETNCNENVDHLISKQICSSLGKIDGRSEFWTGIQRYRYNTTENLTGSERKEVNSTDILNCVYVKCSVESGHGPIEYTENCRERLDGFACILNGSSENVTTGKPSHESSFAPATVSSSESSALHLTFVSTNVQLQSTVKTSVGLTSSLSMYIESSTTNSISQTSVNSVLFSSHERQHVVSINTSSVSTEDNSIGISATTYSSVKSNKKGRELNDSNSMYSTTTMNSNMSGSHEFSTVNSSFETSPEPPIITSSESSSMHFEEISTNVPPKSSVETSLSRKSSVLMHTQSKIASSILQTSATSELSFVHASTHVVSLTTISKSHMTSYIDFSTTVYSSVVKSTSWTESNESKAMHNTTARNQNNILRSQQLSTGLIVGISVSILCLVVLVIGVFCVCRLRNQQAFKEKSSLDFPIPIRPINDPNYHDIDIDPKKETNVIENEPTHPVVSANDNDMPFRLTDKTTNGKTNKPNDAYAVVVKIPVTTKADNISNGKTTKTNDAYAVVVKIPGKNQDKDENTSLDIPESNYDSMNQPRPISGNDSGNIYDTSIGHLDEPTYNTTSHIQAREKKYESDYDHL